MQNFEAGLSISHHPERKWGWECPRYCACHDHNHEVLLVSIMTYIIVFVFHVCAPRLATRPINYDIFPFTFRNCLNTSLSNKILIRRLKPRPQSYWKWRQTSSWCNNNYARKLEVTLQKDLSNIATANKHFPHIPSSSHSSDQVCGDGGGALCSH